MARRVVGFEWDKKQDRKLARIIIKSTREGKQIFEAVQEAVEKFKVLNSNQIYGRWYNHVRKNFLDEFKEAQRYAGIKEAVLRKEKPAAEAPQEDDNQMSIRIDEKNVAHVDAPQQVESKPEAVVEEEVVSELDPLEVANAQLLKNLKGNAVIYNALTFLIQQFAKQEAKMSQMERALRSKDKKIERLEEEKGDLNERLSQFRTIASGR